jgi:hypothetical protein
MCVLHECTCMILLETQRKIRQRMEMAKVSIIPGILGVMKRPLSTLAPGNRVEPNHHLVKLSSFENNRVTNTWRASQPRTEIQTR